jgi:hypothetical protein
MSKHDFIPGDRASTRGDTGRAGGDTKGTPQILEMKPVSHRI